MRYFLSYLKLLEADWAHMSVLTVPLNPCDTVIGISELQPVELLTSCSALIQGPWVRTRLLGRGPSIIRTIWVQRVSREDGQHPIITLHPHRQPGGEPCLVPDGGELGKVLLISEVE